MSRTAATLAAALLMAAVARADDPPAMSSTVNAARANADGTASTTFSTQSFAGESKHVGDIVAMSPGASVIDYGGVLATAVVSVRGASADEVQVVFDGVPLNASVGGGFDLSLIPAVLVDSVEVRRGSDGSRVGAGAMGGAVVLEPSTRSRALLTYGSFNTYGASASWVTPPLKSGWHLLAAVDYRHTDGDFSYHLDTTPEIPNRNVLTLTRLNNSASIGSALLRLDHEVGNGRVSGLLLLGASDRGLPGGIYSPTPDSRQVEGNGFLDLRWQSASDGRWSEQVPLTVKGGVIQTAEAGLGMSSGEEKVIDVSTRPEATLRLGRWVLNASGLAGYEGFVGTQFGSHQRGRGALGLAASLSIGEWTLEASVRGELWGTAWAVLPHAGATVRVARGVVLAASAGSGFRAPSFAELYYASGPVISNPNLRPERSATADLSARFHFGPFSASATGFVGEYQDLILYELFSSFSTKPENIGQSASYGAELEARLAPIGGWWSGLEFLLTGSEIVTRDLVAGLNTYGMEIPYRPQHRGVGRIDYRRYWWRAAVEAQATSVAYINESNTRWVPPFVDLRASAGGRLWRDFWLGAEMRNGLNTMDRMNVDGYPLPGRVFLVNLSWEPAAPDEAK